MENTNFNQDEMQNMGNPVPNQNVVQNAANPNHGYAVASLVLGILSIVLCCCYYIGLVCGIVGLILALVAKKNGNTEGINKAGLVLNIIGVSIGVIFVILAIIGTGVSRATYEEWLRELK